MNSNGVIATLLAIAAAKRLQSYRRTGSSAYINVLKNRDNEWSSLFCHAGDPTYDFIGDIGYIQDTFESEGFVRSEISPDVLYAHLFLKDYMKDNSTYSTSSGEADNFFDLYSRLKREKTPVFILGVNMLGLLKADVNKFAQALSVTLNGRLLSDKDITVDIYNPEIMANERLIGLKYHVYTYDVSAEEVGLPLPKSMITYIVGFRAEKARYIPQPMFPTRSEVSFSDDHVLIGSSSVLSNFQTADTDVFKNISGATLREASKKSYNSKFESIPLKKDTEIHIPYNYLKIGKVTSTYLTSNNNVRTLSLREISLLNDIPIQSDIKSIERFSFTRGLSSLLSIISDTLECEHGRTAMAESFSRALKDLNAGRVDTAGIPKTVSIGGMFSGIGGYEMGIQSGLLMRGIGSNVDWDYEVNTRSQDVFSMHFPEARQMGSIDSEKYPEPVDIVCMGFPCPDVSMAGLRRGIKEGTRSGLFIPAFDKAIRVNPKFILLENVAGMLVRNKETGRTPIEVVINSFMREGWTLEWFTATSRDFGAPHRRKRWFGVAHKMNQSILQTSGTFKECKNRYPKNGIMINGSIYELSPDYPFDMGVRSKNSYPTPVYGDIEKRNTGGLRILLQSGLKRSVGRDLEYPAPLPEGYKWIERGGKMVAKETKRNVFLNPDFVEWMMGFPHDWTKGVGRFPINIENWSQEPYPKTRPVDEVSRQDKVDMAAYGNAIMPHIPSFLAYAYLWKHIK